jgi:hypothetical protein
MRFSEVISALLSIGPVLAQQITPGPLRRDAESFSCPDKQQGCLKAYNMVDDCGNIYIKDTNYLTADRKYSYCLCTTGYYSAAAVCNMCSPGLSTLARSFYTELVKQGECSALYSHYGTPVDNTAIATTSSPTSTTDNVNSISSDNTNPTPTGGDVPVGGTASRGSIPSMAVILATTIGVIVSSLFMTRAK